MINIPFFTFSKIGNEPIYVDNKLVAIDEIRNEVDRLVSDMEIYRSGND